MNRTCGDEAQGPEGKELSLCFNRQNNLEGNRKEGDFSKHLGIHEDKIPRQ